MFYVLSFNYRRIFLVNIEEDIKNIVIATCISMQLPLLYAFINQPLKKLKKISSMNANESPDPLRIHPSKNRKEIYYVGLTELLHKFVD